MSRGELETYQKKRDFRSTPEPRGELSQQQGNRYLIQKHDARRLHYDLRLELDGVLKSWAVTRGPSLDPADKRLAVRTEDHPVDYGDFEGVIPSGYGAGTVMLWDTGTWKPKDDPRAGLKKGALKFELQGERLRGGFALVRMRNKKGEKRENWLLVKQRDEFADENADPLENWTTSIVSKRDMAAIEGNADAGQAADAANRSNSAKAGSGSDTKQTSPRTHKPDFVPPQLASLREQPPEGDDWLHELKYDGYRIQALIAAGEVRLMTRNRKDWTDKYPEVERALSELPVEDAVIDGELVALDEKGHSRFELLQNASGSKATTLAYYAFDLLHLDGKSLLNRPLLERKNSLEKLLNKNSEAIRYSDHIRGRGDRIIDKACAMHLEGVVSKRANSRYRSGRGHNWIKSKCAGNDEFVVVGYRRSDKAGRPFSSLLLGEYRADDLHYCGRVGTGFDETTLAKLQKKMTSLQRSSSPLAETPSDATSRAVWLRPKLVAQIRYTERTADGRLRHPSFLGLRTDKSARAVEAPQPLSVDDSKELLAGVHLTHPERVMFPQQGATKRAIAEYYQNNAARVLQYLADRPLSLVRCPRGRDQKCFFQRHHGSSLPEHLRRTDIREKDGSSKPYLYIDSPEGLIAATQIGVLELHLWGCRRDRIERPERLVFDLDPDVGLGFDDVRQAALDIRDLLAALGLTSYPLLTGGKGIHVVVPLQRRRDWDDVKLFARGLAQKLTDAEPGRFVATASKARRKNRVFIDWLRNERGSSAIAPYSLRARPGAPVATPIAWGELSRIDSADTYTLDNIARRLAQLKRDPWDGYETIRQSLTNSQLAAVS